MRRRGGFTLAEAIASTFLIFAVLGAAASLFVSYSTLMRHSSPKERSLATAQVALDHLRSEAPTAIQWYEPNPASLGTVYSRMVFDKVDPGVLTRLPDPVTVTTFFDPRDPGDLCQIEYSLNNGALVRKTWGSGYSNVEVVAEGITGFSTVMNATDLIQLSLTVDENGTPRTMSSQAALWIDP